MVEISREEFLQRLNQHLNSIDCVSVASDAEIVHHIKAYQDPLTAKQMRCLLNLWAGLYAYRSRLDAAKRPRKAEDTHAMSIIKSIVEHVDYEPYCYYLLDFVPEYSKAYVWGFIALARAKSGLCDDAVQFLTKVSDDDYRLLSHILPYVALELFKNSDARYLELLQRAYIAAQTYSGDLILSNPPHANPIPYVLAEIALASGQVEEYTLALQIAREITKLTVRAKTLAQIALFLPKTNSQLFANICDEIKALMDAKNSDYESIYSHWQSEILLELAHLQTDRTAKFELLHKSFNLAQTHSYSPRDSYWLLAEAFARHGDAVSAMQVIEKMEKYWKAQLTADIAGIVAGFDSELADGLFKNAIRLAHEQDHVSSVAQSFKAIAINYAKLERYDDALGAIGKMNYLDSDKTEPLRLIAIGLAQKQELARALSVAFTQEFHRHFFSDLCDFAQAIETFEAGSWLLILQDSLKIHSWIDPIWEDVLKRLSV